MRPAPTLGILLLAVAGVGFYPSIKAQMKGPRASGSLELVQPSAELQSKAASLHSDLQRVTTQLKEESDTGEAKPTTEATITEIGTRLEEMQKLYASLRDGYKKLPPSGSGGKK